MGCTSSKTARTIKKKSSTKSGGNEEGKKAESDVNSKDYYSTQNQESNIQNKKQAKVIPVDDNETIVKNKKGIRAKNVIEEDDDNVTMKLNKKKQSELDTNPNNKTMVTLSGAFKYKNKNTQSHFRIVKGEYAGQNLAGNLTNLKLISEAVIAQFNKYSEQEIIERAQENQIVIKDTEEQVDYGDLGSIIRYIKNYGLNYSEVFSLNFLAKGGQSYVMRAELKQPVEVVIKTVLPENSSEEALAQILEETQIIKMLSHPEKIVEVYEEIIEFSEEKQQIQNYFVVVEQGINDLAKIVQMWIAPLDQEGVPECIQNLEFFSNYKLFYFLLKAAELLQYLHDRGVYYGDMKEQNVLIFRNYDAKLGDFGISVVFGSEDPDEQVNQLKGLTHGYCTRQFEKAFTEDGWLFSKNEMIANDYYALRMTFEKIKAKCIERFTSEGRKKKKDLYEFKYDEESYFEQFLKELATLHPDTKPLSFLILKYRTLVEADNSFHFGFCNQLAVDEKFLAIPNALSLWKHKFIPKTIRDYFEFEQYSEYPFLRPSINKIKSMNNVQGNQDDVVAEIQAYINQNIPLDTDEKLNSFQKYIKIIALYKSCQRNSFTHEFYRKIFGSYFKCRSKLGGQQLLYLMKINQDQKIKENLKFKIELVGSMILEGQTKKIKLYKIDEEHVFNQLFNFLIFYNQTSLQSDDVGQLESIMNELKEVMKNNSQFSRNSKQIRLQDLELLLELDINYLESKFRAGLYHAQKLFNLQQKKFKVQLYNDYSKYTLLTYMKEISSSAQTQDAFLEGTSLGNLKLKHTAFFQEVATVFEGQACKLFDSQDFHEQREIMRRTYGELGNELSQQSYQVYKKLKEKSKLNEDDDDDQAYIYLQKAYYYSEKSQKSDFFFELIEETQNRKEKQKLEELLQEGKVLNYPLYELVNFQILKQEKNLAEFSKSILKIEDQKALRSAIKQNQQILKVLIDYLEFEKRLIKSNFDYVLKEFKVKDFLSQYEKVQTLENVAIEGARVEVSEFDGLLKKVYIQYDDAAEVEIIIDHSGAITRELKYDLWNGLTHFKETYVNNRIDGPFKYKLPDQEIKGMFKSGIFSNCEAEFYNKHTYHGSMEYFSREGCGYLNTTTQQFYGYWENNEMLWAVQEGGRVEKRNGYLSYYLKGYQHFKNRLPYGASFSLSEAFTLSIQNVQLPYYSICVSTQNLDYYPNGQIKVLRGKNSKKLFYESGALYFCHHETTVKQKHVYYENGREAIKKEVKGTPEIYFSYYFSRSQEVQGVFTSDKGFSSLIGEGAMFFVDSEANAQTSILKSDKYNGYKRKYYPSGSLLCEKYYSNGQIQRFAKFYQNGNLQSISRPISTQLRKILYFDQSGNEIGTCLIKQGRPACGIQFSFYKNGQIRVKKMFENSKKVARECYYSNGERIYENVNGEYQIYNDSGVIIAHYSDDCQFIFQKFNKDETEFSRSETSTFQLLPYQKDLEPEEIELYEKEAGAQPKFERHKSFEVLQHQNRLVLMYSHKYNLVRINMNKDFILNFFPTFGIMSKSDKNTGIGETYCKNKDMMIIFSTKEKNNRPFLSYVENCIEEGEQRKQNLPAQGKIFVFHKENHTLLQEKLIQNCQLVYSKFYYSNGALALEQHYKKNHLDGRQVFFWPHGGLAYEIFYQDTNLHGTSKFFSKKGVLIATMKFDKGQLIDTQTFRPDIMEGVEQVSMAFGNGEWAWD